jgi:hypothetical protein
MGPQRPRARLRGLTALRGVAAQGLALVALLTYGQTLGHDLLERHQLCSEHGELVHAGEAHSDGGEHARSASPETSAESRVRDVAASSEHDHEHCALACSRSDLTIASAQAGVQPPAPGASGALPAPAVTHHASSPSYRVAPKQSPPV